MTEDIVAICHSEGTSIFDIKDQGITVIVEYDIVDGSSNEITFQNRSWRSTATLSIPETKVLISCLQRFLFDDEERHN